MYCNGVKINATSVSTTAYSVPNAAYGVYTVTATGTEGESSESNKVIYGESTAISLPEATNANDGNVYGVDGKRLGTDTHSLQPGLYVRNGKKMVVK